MALPSPRDLIETLSSLHPIKIVNKKTAIKECFLIWVFFWWVMIV